MNVLIATDSFKGSLTSIQAGQAIAKGISLSKINATVDLCPIADGGEGTVDAFFAATNATKTAVKVTGPLGKQAECTFCRLGDLAVLEMASCAGLVLVGQNKNPLVATTFGVGEAILHAIKNGCKKFVVGIGGSATNDGGIGMLQALGFDFLDTNGNPVAFGANGLKNLCTISTSNKNPLLEQCEFVVACDVTNPLCGANGCSKIYAPQKGATPQMANEMDLWMQNYARLTKQATNTDFADTPGAGAAGGMGFAFLAYLGATLQSGAQIIARATKLEERITKADLVVVGEGKIDNQTLFGKAPHVVAKLAKKHNKKVVAFCGISDLQSTPCIDKIFCTCNGTPTQHDLETTVAFDKLVDKATQVFSAMEIL
ncbi:MAG: glycerate kinase [Clostridiales bacterium]|nr:glycerate kinase [Clostridiales bacterium]